MREHRTPSSLLSFAAERQALTVSDRPQTALNQLLCNLVLCRVAYLPAPLPFTSRL